jgi:PAS domain S-box-containing protein
VARDITGSKRTGVATSRLAAIVESSDDAIIGKDLSGVITNWNSASEKVFGYSAQEMVGQSILRLIPPDRQQEEIGILSRIRRGENVRHFETVRLRKDGSAVDVSVTVSAIRDFTGKIVGASKMVRDISVSKRAEEARRASEGRYRTLFDYAPDGILIADPASRYIDANASMCQMLGYTREELIGLHASDIVAQTEVPEIDPALSAIKAKSDHRREWKFRRKDGSVFEAEVIATMMPDGNLMAMIRDITERRQAAENLRSTSARLQHLLEHSPAVIYGLKIEGEKIFPYVVSENVTQLLGFAVAETLSYEWWAAQLHPDDRDRAIKSISETLANNQSRTEYRLLHKNGAAIWVDDNRRLIRNVAGEPAEFVGVWTDITEKKNLEAQFLRAQRMESIGTLAGGIAHDLNNILAPIMMSIDLLKTISDHPQAKKILETIEISAKRGADIVRQVLSFARGVEGERVEIQPKHLLRELEDIIKDTFPKDIRMEFSIPNGIWTILGDPTQVHQILLNLCVNARDAMPHGGRLTVGVENCVLDEHYAARNSQAKPGRYIDISVTDSGTGIPPGILNKIFEPFFTTKELNKGTGLGLSTVMAIVKSHDGIINVYSELSKGTTFKVYLPAMDSSSEAQKEQSKEARLPRGNGETVLVVDDEASILIITSQTLQAFGYRILTATDGADAIAVYLQQRDEITVVLTDMMMPVMDGPAMIHALTRINPAIKIIAASGLKPNDGAAKVSAAGFRRFLMKPYTTETLLKTIRATLDEREFPLRTDC